MINLGPITQFGFVTDDLEKTATVWTKLGVAPFTKMSGVKMPATMDGETVEIVIDVALAYQGDVQIELSSPYVRVLPLISKTNRQVYGAHITPNLPWKI